MIVHASAAIALFAAGTIVLWGAVIPLAAGMVEWVFNVGETRRPR